MESFENACRLCLWKGDKMVNIFSEDADIQKKIHTCLPVRVYEGDTVTKQICCNCNYKLEIFCEFYNICVRSDTILRQYLADVNGDTRDIRFNSNIFEEEIQLRNEEIEHIFGKVNCAKNADKSNLNKTNHSKSSNLFDFVEEIDLTEDQSQESDILIYSADEILDQIQQSPFASHQLRCDLMGRNNTLITNEDENYYIESLQSNGRRDEQTPKRGNKLNSSQDLYNSPVSHENVCQYCDKIFQNANMCAAHVEGHLRKQYCVCKFCNRAFISELMLQQHRANECKEPKVSPKRNCNVLQIKSPVVILKPIHVCFNCSKICESKAKLVEHSKTCQSSAGKKRKYQRRKFKASLLPIRTRALKKIQVDIINEVLGSGDSVSSQDLEKTLLESVGLNKIGDRITV